MATKKPKPKRTKHANLVKIDKAPTLRQYDFAIAYCGEAYGNGVQASRLAHYKGSDAVMAVTAHENLRNPKVIALIAKIRQETERRARSKVMSRHETLVRISQIADGSLADVVNEHGDFDLQDARRRGTDYILKKVRERRTIIHRPRYSRRKAGANAEYVQPKHDFRLTPEGKYLCVGCEAEVSGKEAIQKITSGEGCTMKADNDVERVEYVTFEYTIEDRIKALDLMAKHHGIINGQEDLDPRTELRKIFEAHGIPERLMWVALERLRNAQAIDVQTVSEEPQ